MKMNEIMWEERLDIAVLVELGAINRAPTVVRRLLAGAGDGAGRVKIG